jgi:hypothetical protein
MQVVLEQRRAGEGKRIAKIKSHGIHDRKVIGWVLWERIGCRETTEKPKLLYMLTSGLHLKEFTLSGIVYYSGNTIAVN